VDAPIAHQAPKVRPRFQRAAAALAAVLIALAILPHGARGEGAAPAGAFVDSIGINTHTYYSDTVYGARFPDVKQRLAELGIHHIRENLVVDRPDQYQGLRELSAMGIRSTLVLGDPDEGEANLQELLATTGGELGGAVEALEGPNEFDQRGGSDWAQRLRQYQQRLYVAVKSDPALAGLPVLGPSIVQRAHEQELGDISGMLDYGNTHSYPDGEEPESNIASRLESAGWNSGSKPVIATETGYHTALGGNGEHEPVSEQAMATYLPRLYLEYFRRGIPRTFSYELLDEGPGGVEQEDSFGLLRNDLTPKPAFDALRSTIRLLDDPGPAFTPVPLDYRVGGDRTGLSRLLLQKRDGSYYLALWRSESVWDTASRSPLQPYGGIVQLRFRRTIKSAVAYLPSRSNDAATVLNGEAGQIEVPVGADAVIVALSIGKPIRPGRIRLWLSRRWVPAGAKVAVRGRLPRQAVGRPQMIEIQRWQKGRWRSIGRGRATRSGAFRKKVRFAHDRGGLSRIRVVARSAKPSRPVRIRVR
jgi:hypothetical protein